MQFHLNGFKLGNYQVPDAARKPYPNPPIEDLPSEVDVLIIGTGPAWLTMARQMSKFTDIKTCIVDTMPGPLLFGRADGISCRTIEIMEAFNSSEMVVKETYKLKQNTFWEPDAANPKNINAPTKSRMHALAYLNLRTVLSTKRACTSCCSMAWRIQSQTCAHITVAN